MFDTIKSSPLLWLVIFLAVVAPSFLFGAVKVVLYIILGVILLFVILGLIFRVKIQSMRSQMEDQMRNATGQTHTRNTTNTEGDVKIYATPKTQEKRVNKDVGDYVDFEEIKK